MPAAKDREKSIRKREQTSLRAPETSTSSIARNKRAHCLAPNPRFHLELFFTAASGSNVAQTFLSAQATLPLCVRGDGANLDNAGACA